MDELHNNKLVENDNSFVPKEGQRGLLCSNKKSFRCPSLDYKHIVALESKLDNAFDILFEEVTKLT